MAAGITRPFERDARRAGAVMTCGVISVFVAVSACGDAGRTDGGDAVTDLDVPSNTDAHVHDAPPSDGSDGAPFDAIAPDASDAGLVDGDTPAAPTIHNCATFVDRSSAAADRTIAFRNFTYEPSCMQIAVGQSVRFSGDFATHQLRPGVAISRAGVDPPGTTPNPIPPMDTGLTLTVTFPAAGTYPYYCLDHEGTGMYGVVRVR